MKTVLLLHPKLLFYKIPIYNKLSDYLLKKNIKLIIWYTQIEPQNEFVNFSCVKNKELNIKNYYSYVKNENISHVINILSMSEPGYLFYFTSILIAKYFGKKNVFYGHGMNLKYSSSWLIKSLYNIIHLTFDKIILYTPNEIKLLWKVNQAKVSIAFNTLDLEDSQEFIPNLSRKSFKLKYNIKEDFIVLFSGRIQDRKKLNYLLDIFQQDELKKIGLVIVGPGISESEIETVSLFNNIYYLGPIYDRFEISSVFYSCNLFCIPGHIGLGLIEAMFWGLPVITTSFTKHAPEIYYLKNGYNGYLLDSKSEIMNKIIELANNPQLTNELSNNAKTTYKDGASISNLLRGFYKSLC